VPAADPRGAEPRDTLSEGRSTGNRIPSVRLDLRRLAPAWAEVACRTVERPYPHGFSHVLSSERDLVSHRDLHPSFYGSFDWHSAVEMHWVLVRLWPLLAPPLAGTVRDVLDRHLDPEPLAVEADYLRAHPGFERPYGWGWLLALCDAAASPLVAPVAGRWQAGLAPLAALVEERLCAWLEVSPLPVRHGMHANTAFALERALLYARHHSEPLRVAINRAARRYFLADRDYPAHYEPSATDFLSPALTEAALLADVVPPATYPSWLGAFLPGLVRGEPAVVFEPVDVVDPTDGQLAHFHGLNLSKAAGLARLAAALPGDDPRRRRLEAAAWRHATASLEAVVGSDYMVEHWLAAFGLLAVDALGALAETTPIGAS